MNAYLALAEPFLDRRRFDRWAGIPGSIELPWSEGRLYSEHQARRALVSRFAWAIPCRGGIEAIARRSPGGGVEIGAGTGYWASLLAEAGVDVVAYEPNPPGNGNHWHDGRGGQEPYHPLTHGWGAYSKRHPDRTLLLCWPPYDAPMADVALRNYAGDVVAYVGEGEGGCTGCDRFHRRLRREWRRDEVVEIPQWPCTNDRLELWVRA